MSKFLRFMLMLLMGILVSGAMAKNSSASSTQPDPTHPDQFFLRTVGPEIQISPPGEAERRYAAVAYNTREREFLVVWHNEWPGGEKDIYARRITEKGEIKSWFTVAIGPYDKSHPDVVYNETNNEYLVVWMDEDVSGLRNIWGKIIPWNGLGTNAAFEIISWPNRDFGLPKAAWDSKRNQYMVAWSAINTLTIQFADVSNAILSDSGIKIWGAIMSTADQPNAVDITYHPDLDEYLAVWTTDAWDLNAAALTTDKGYVKDPPGIQTIRSNAEHPSVAVKKWGIYEIVWQEKTGDNYNVYGKNCSWYMNMFLCSPMPDLGITPKNEKWPQIATSPDGFDFLVTYSQSDPVNFEVWAYYEKHGSGEIIRIADVVNSKYDFPDAALGDSVGLVAYHSFAGSNPPNHILGRLIHKDSQTYLPIVIKNDPFKSPF